MESRIVEELPIGIYRSDDDIKCLRVTVNLRKLEPSSLLSESTGSNQAADDVELLQMRPGIKPNIHEEYEFLWQEKVFNHEEIKHYAGDTASCSNLKNSEKRNLDAREKVKERNRRRIFSYVDAEISLEKYQNKKPVTIPLLNPSYMEAKMRAVGLRTKILHPYSESKTFQLSSFPATKTIIQWPSKQIVAINHAFQTRGQFMIIMADISSSDSVSNFESEETVLCFMHFDSCGVLTVVPDFNISHMPYTVVNSKSEHFEYTIEHTSNSINEPEAKREKNLNKKLHTQHAEVLGVCVGTDFEMPLMKSSRIFIYGEIVAARNFIADSLYVQYYFDLPKDWFSLNAELLAGVTNTCTARNTNTEGKIIYFGFPVDIELQTKVDQCSKSGNLSQCLQMFVEIVSFDNWGCCRTEGYGYCNVPLSPGCHSMTLNTWKLVPQSLINKLRQYFIGGTPCLEDLIYTRFPSHTKDLRLSKYALWTETSGTLTVKFNIICNFG